MSIEDSCLNRERRTDNGEHPVIPYARQWIDEEDIQAVVEVLRSDWLTTGPKVSEFEQAFAGFVGAEEAVVVNSGTAALHAAMYALGIGLGDEVILPPMTFVATANAVVFQGGTPVFADVDPDTLLIDPTEVEEKITPRTKAIIAVDYAGHPCDYDALWEIAHHHGLFLIADACHALGAAYKGRKVGTLADLTVFSFHPVKHITTGEGGMVTTDNPELAERMRIFRNHGITRNAEMFTVHCSPFTVQRQTTMNRQWTTDNGQGISDNGQQTTVNGERITSSWYYEMQDLGYNYRITDIQCALGLSQLPKLPGWISRRREIAAKYDEALADIPGIEPLGLRSDVLSAKQSAMRPAPSSISFSPSSMLHAPCSMPSSHAYHLYVVNLSLKEFIQDRAAIFSALREEGIGVNVHYIPVHLQPYYRERFGYQGGECPVAEAAYEHIISLPMFHKMSDEDVEDVLEAVNKVVMRYAV